MIEPGRNLTCVRAGSASGEAGARLIQTHTVPGGKSNINNDTAARNARAGKRF